MKKLSLLAFCLFSCAVVAQAPYRLSWAGDAPTVGVGLTYAAVSHFAWKPAPLTEAQLLAQVQTTADINPIDRPVISNYNHAAANVSDVLLYASVAAPLLLLTDDDIRKGDNPAIIGSMYAETILINYAVTDAFKKSVLRSRPYTYNPNVPISEREDVDGRYSFFSGHTSQAAASSFFAAQVFNDYHPNSPLLPYVWGVAALLPAATAFERVQAGKHFPTDVLVGYLVGAAIGVIVPRLHRINR